MLCSKDKLITQSDNVPWFKLNPHKHSSSKINLSQSPITKRTKLISFYKSLEVPFYNSFVRFGSDLGDRPFK